MTQVIQSVHEPAVRMAISAIDQVINYHLPHLPQQQTIADDHLECAVSSLNWAKIHLREWANRCGIEIQDGMKT